MRPSPPEVVIATGNPGKVGEITAILGAESLRLRSLADFPEVELPEEGEDYEANAVAKARAAALITGLPALADDSGLEVEALGWGPGPGSARYGGPGLDDAARVARLLAALRDSPAPSRRARFVCVAALATPDGRTAVARGECAGQILPTARGRGGFGYDPVFAPEGRAVSMAELPAEEKNRISHRGRAFRALADAIRRLAGDGTARPGAPGRGGLRPPS